MNIDNTDQVIAIVVLNMYMYIKYVNNEYGINKWPDKNYIVVFIAIIYKIKGVQYNFSENNQTNYI